MTYSTGRPKKWRPPHRPRTGNLYWICTGFPFPDPRKYRENRQLPKWFCKVLQGTLRCRFDGFSREKHWVCASSELAFISRVSPVQVRPLLMDLSESREHPFNSHRGHQTVGQHHGSSWMKKHRRRIRSAPLPAEQDDRHGQMPEKSPHTRGVHVASRGGIVNEVYIAVKPSSVSPAPP